MPLFEDRCSFPREAVTACGVRLLTMWRVKAGGTYRREIERSRQDSREKIHQAGRNLVVVRTDNGQGTITVRGRSHRVTKGSLLLFDFPALEWYQTEGHKWHFWWVELALSEPPHVPLYEVLMTPPLRGESARCESVFDGLHAESIEQRYLATAAWQYLFYEWWAHTASSRQPLPTADLGVQRTLEAIKRRPDLPWALEDMAAVAGMTPPALRGAYHRVLGASPAQMKIQIKLSHAHEHLRRGDRNVSEVATMLGFCDPFHFSKAFKKQFGYSPSTVGGRLRPGESGSDHPPE